VLGGDTPISAPKGIIEILGNNSLTNRLALCSGEDFPHQGSVNFQNRLMSVWEYLTNNIYPHIGAMAALVDGGYLTDHGQDHVKTVIARAAALVGTKPEVLTCYETYLFIAAVIFHDVGNIFGRPEHETKLGEVMQALGAILGNEGPEIRAIWQIAQAHGGKSKKGDRDKISLLEPQSPVLGREIRLRVLAALLRFADELADDHTRAAKVLALLKIIPTSSEVYHKYASSLHSVLIKVPGDAIDLAFELSTDDVICEFGKGSGAVLVIDEIYERTLKMHFERIYCMRFLRPIVSIEQINVTISVYGDRFSSEKLKLSYRLQETGYPDTDDKQIFDFCKPFSTREDMDDAPTGGAVKKMFLNEKEGNSRVPAADNE
jgi:hypothetical protein